ncbi:MAG: hypothetical protein ABEJ78_11855 [Haloferacaceae archaeon]
MRRLAVLLVVALLLGSSLVADSPCDSNVDAERDSFARERPATLDRTSAATYLVDYERTRLANDLLGARGYTLDRGDEIRTDCAAVARDRVGDGAFRIRLRCHGEITDVYRLIRPTRVTYTVTYRLTNTTTTQCRIRGYPYDVRDELRRPPWAET